MLDPKQHAQFRLATLDDLRAAIEELGLDLSVEEDLSYLTRPVMVGAEALPNAMAIQPMEGCDGTADGAPDKLTFRRYERFGAGGAGLLWFEACAVVPEGRANPRQLWLHSDTKDKFARLVEAARKAARGAGIWKSPVSPFGGDSEIATEGQPYLVLQLTHSGRYSRPGDEPKPIIAHHDPILDRDRGLPADYPLVTDDYLEELEDKYVEAARLAFEVGFDAVDVKAGHRYLINELLAAHTRVGDYGGSYENRTRFLKNVIGKIRTVAGPNKTVTCRLGVYDAHPYPYGWGVDREDSGKPNLSEPLRLAAELRQMGLPLINITMGNPYFNPHVNRPYDRPVEGERIPDEHPLIGVARLAGLTREIQRSVPDVVIVGSGYSWLRNLWPYVAAANIRDGGMKIVGLGRQAFAYPAFAKEIIETGKLDRRHTCIACSSCTQIMRDGGRAGCVPFDKEVYGPIYREGRHSSIEYVRAQAARCRDCFDPRCRDGCPAGVDVPGFVKALADGDLRRSYEILRESNLLPELCAYVCPAEVQCEAECIESVFSGDPVPIRELQRYVSRVARKKGWAALPMSVSPTGKRVAVIGAGPAGLACAARLLQMGHSVEMFDISRNPGGAAAATIPAQRLLNEDFDAEIKVLFDQAGDRFAFHPGEGLTEAQDLDAFAKEFDAVFLGIGLGDSPRLTGERPDGVEDAISFLRRAKLEGAVVPNRVAVLGGGNTAMDAAVTAASAGARDVYLVYRRSFAEMPAWPSERDEALAMGVHFLILTQAVDYVIGEDDRLLGLRIARTALGPPGPDGRRTPQIIPGSESVLEVDLVLEALGQGLPEGMERLLRGVELTKDRLLKVDENGKTSRPGVFAGGDVVNGGATVVQAVAEGMRAAAGIDAYLIGTGTNFNHPHPDPLPARERESASIPVPPLRKRRGGGRRPGVR